MKKEKNINSDIEFMKILLKWLNSISRNREESKAKDENNKELKDIENIINNL